MSTENLERQKANRQALLNRLKKDDVRKVIQKKRDFFKKGRWFSFPFVLGCLLEAGCLLAFLPDVNLFYYHPLSNIGKFEILSFFTTSATVGYIGGMIRQFYNLFITNWEVESLDEELEMEPFLNQPNPLDHKKIQKFINSSMSNKLFIRPIFMPILGSMAAIFSVLLIYQFDAGIIRIVIIGFPAGIIAKDIIFGLIDKAQTVRQL